VSIQKVRYWFNIIDHKKDLKIWWDSLFKLKVNMYRLCLKQGRFFSWTLSYNILSAIKWGLRKRGWNKGYSYKTSFHKTSSSSKRPFYKTSFHRTSRLQNVLGYKTSSSTKRPAHKTSFPQNVLTYKTSLPSKRPSTKRPSLCHSTKRPFWIHVFLYPKESNSMQMRMRCSTLQANIKKLYTYSESSNIGLVVLDFLQANDAKSRPSQYCLIHYR
jgi:hypothetical protein